MKIVHFTFSLNNGGKENLLADIANEQSKAGHEIAIVIVNDRYDQVLVDRILNGIKVVHLKRGSGILGLLWLIKLFVFLKISFRPDVIHCHDAGLGKLLRYISAKTNALTLHGLEFNVAALKYFNKIFSISHTVTRELEKAGVTHSILVYNGVNISAIKYKQNNSDASRFRIVQVGNLLHEYKGQDVLLRAMDILVNKKKIRDISVEFIGEGKSRMFLENLIEQLKLQQFVSVMGSRERSWVYEHLCKYDVLVQPGRNEGFGLTVTEALAAGLPVIASKGQGPSEILQDGKFGFVFENESAVQLADLILQVKNSYHSPQLKTMVESAFMYCTKEFDIKKTSERYLSLYTAAV